MSRQQRGHNLANVSSLPLIHQSASERHPQTLASIFLFFPTNLMRVHLSPSQDMPTLFSRALFLGQILHPAGLFVSGPGGLGRACCWLAGIPWHWLGSLAGDGINGNDSDGLVAKKTQSNIPMPTSIYFKQDLIQSRSNPEVNYVPYYPIKGILKF